MPDLTLILFECGESLILVDRTDMILIRLNLISSSKSGGFDPEISIFFILLEVFINSIDPQPIEEVPLRPYLFHSGGHQSFLHYV